MNRKYLGLFAAVVIALVAAFTFTLRQRSATKTEDIGARGWKVIAILPLTGNASALGEWVKNGLEIARAHLIGSGITNLEMEYVDSQNDPKTAVSGYQGVRLTSKNVLGVISAMSSVTNALAPIVQNDGIPLLATTVSASGVTRGHPNLFRLFVRSDRDANYMARFAHESLKLNRIAVIYIEDDFGLDYKEHFSKTFTAGGGQIVEEVAYRRNQADFRQILSPLREHEDRIEAMYLLGYANHLGVLPVQARELGFKQPFLSIGTLAQDNVLQQAGASLTGSFYTFPDFDPTQPTKDIVGRFAKDYSGRYGGSPNYFAAFAYDSLGILAAAVAKNSSTQAEGVIRELLELEPYQGVAGTIRFNADRDAEFPMVIRRIDNDKHTVVWRLSNSDGQ